MGNILMSRIVWLVILFLSTAGLSGSGGGGGLSTACSNDMSSDCTTNIKSSNATGFQWQTSGMVTAGKVGILTGDNGTTRINTDQTTFDIQFSANDEFQFFSSGQLKMGKTGTNSGQLSLLGSTSGQVDLTVQATAGSYTVTMPAAVGANGSIWKFNDTVGGLSFSTDKLVKTFTTTYDPASLTANTSRCDDVTVTGITTTGGAVSANIGAVDPAAGCVVASVRVNGANTVRVCWRNAIDATTACDTATSTWTFSQAQ
jgi:hypothetical protein